MRTNYTNWWKKIDELIEKQGKQQTALTEVKALQAAAEKDGKTDQEVKAVLYRLQLEATVEEESDAKAYTLLQNNIAKSQGIRKALYEGLLGDFLQKYYDNHRWQLYNRTGTTGGAKGDITTWSKNDFNTAIANAYRASLSQTSLLQRIPAKAIAALVVSGNAGNTRPTAYDLIAWRALSYFKQEEDEAVQSADRFRMTDPALLGRAVDFIALSIPKNGSSNHLTALQLYQSLLQFHLKSGNTAALVNTDLDRLQFVKEHLMYAGKIDLYRQALKTMAASSSSSRDAVLLVLAESYRSDAPVSNVEAVTLLKELINSKDGRTKALSTNLLQEIQTPSLGITLEKVNLPDQPFRALIAYQNSSTAFFRLYKMSETLRSSLRRGRQLFEEKGWAQLKAAPLQKEWQQDLPLPGDYNSHRTEVKIDALAAGEYLLLASTDNSFTIDKSTMAATVVRVSGISYVHRGDDYFILDRNTGQPLSKAGVQTWKEKYDRASQEYILVKGERFIANEQGYINMKLRDDNSSVLLDISFHNDRLFLDEMMYHYRYTPGKTKTAERDRAQTWFFLDRSIYRPGQMLQFKGIAITQDTSGKSKVYSKQKVTVQLLNANNEVTDTLVLTTNDYGSILGSFTLPESGLNGSFRLQQKEWAGNAYFRVEEYKRPKFQVEFDALKGAYRVNDSIAVTGIAKAYAGNTISNAQVTFRVTRKSRFPLYWRRIWPPVSADEVEITNGVATTGADGRFTIRFTALPDVSIDKSTDPSFDYVIQADVTDLNGETRSASQSVTVSYKAIQLTMGDLPETMQADSLQTIGIYTRNSGGQFQPASLQVQVMTMEAPARQVRHRYWDQPDQYVMDETTFVRHFPLDEYRNETEPNSWNNGQEVFRQTITTTPDGQVAINWKNRKAGWYRIRATGKDLFGDSLRTERVIFLFEPGKTNVPGFLFSHTDKSSAQPGDKVTLYLGTSNDTWLISMQEDRDKLEKDDQLDFANRFEVGKVNAGIRAIPYTVQEKDRGGFGWSQVFVQHNRVYAASANIAVPWSNKDLTLSVSSFRDKTLPGSEETWKVTVKGPKGEKTTAELLTSMYDASLDQFAFHSWSSPYIWPMFHARNLWNGNSNFDQKSSEQREATSKRIDVDPVVNDRLLALSWTIERLMGGRVMMSKKENRGYLAEAPGAPPVLEMAKATAPKIVADAAADAAMHNQESPSVAANGPAATRTDFRETAFFFPQLSTDADGNHQFSFTMPESLTSWKWQMLAHTKDLSFGSLTQTIITQKDLMVQTNMPRFLREGDKMEITAKVVNLSDKEMTGQAELQLIDPATNEPLDGWFRNFFPNQYFTVAAGGSEAVRFPVEVPYLFNKAMTWRIVARSGEFSDGESASLPVLTNRELVTETKPFFLNGNGNKDIRFDHLLNSGSSETLSTQSLTVEYSSNPAWYAVQALPYLADYPYECAEQTFNRLYANLLAAHIVAKMPKIKTVLETWRGKDTAALLSNLQKNAELKQVLLEETPWVMQAANETEQKKKIAALFDLVRLAANTGKIAGQLAEMQNSSGGFSWFKGGPDDRYITQYILTGIGRLKMMGAIPASLSLLNHIVDEAIPYLDRSIRDDYNKRDKKNENAAQLSDYAAQYLYMRSYFPEKGIEGNTVNAANYYRKQAQQHWIKGGKLLRGMIATMLFRTGDKITAQKILASLEESAVVNEEMGMYWKDNTGGYYWQQAPIETQAMMVETFQTIQPNGKAVAALKTWLLKNKQTNHWSSTKSTADACYALLLQGGNWLDASPTVAVKLGDVTTITAPAAEAGTGYYQKKIPGTAVHPEMGNISVQVKNAGTVQQPPVWGAVYWQYFENMDKITAAASPLSLKKEVFVERLTSKGPVLEKYQDGVSLKVGDKIQVRITLTTDRSMEYVHVKDLRASNLEPVNVLSEYRWQGGLGYYQSTRDASMNFFISYLPKGTYVFDYALFVNQAGQFSNGIAKAQSMYAPEFSSHSEAIQLRVE